MRYEFNVLKMTEKGQYMPLFSTSERSALTYAAASILYHELCLVFPEPQYKITATKWPLDGFGVDPELELI